MNKKLPFTKSQIQEIIKKYPTPFHIYDEQGIIENANRLIDSFSWAHEFKEYFAVKATPTPKILKLLKNEGCGLDCSSMAELVMAERVGVTGEDIMFSSNDTPAEEFVKAKSLGAIINLDDISHIDYLEKHAGSPDLICCRYNPGPLRGGNAIIGKPEEAKYGFTRKQMFEGYKILKERGIKRFGMHTMIASNELDPQYFIDTAKMLFELYIDINKELDIRMEFLNMGGGIGIPYQPHQKAVDLNYIGKEIQKTYDEMIRPANLHPLKIFFECGRMITGPNGYLISNVLHKKQTYKNH